MALPGNGIFVVRGEISTLMTAIRRGNRWSPSNYQEEEQDGLMKQFIDLKVQLNNIEDLRLIDPNVFLAPFLEVIRSEETTGQITSLALSALNKFLSYGLIDPTHSTLAATVENIADAVTHARFVGSDQASDGVVLMKIVQVLRTLMLSPEGSALTNESVCEVMLSCFRICFEPRLNELLRRTAEHALKDIILLLFMRLPQFAEERHASGLIKKLKMMASGSGGIEQTHKRRKSAKNSHKNATKSSATGSRPVPTVKCDDDEDDEGRTGKESSTGDSMAVNQADHQPGTPNQLLVAPKQSVLATTPLTPIVGNIIVDMQGKFMQTPNSGHNATATTPTSTSGNVSKLATEPTSEYISSIANEEKQQLLAVREDSVENDADVEEDPDEIAKVDDSGATKESASTPTPKTAADSDASVPVAAAKEANASTALIPYGLPCIRELLRFLISLCNPLDKQNTDAMIHMGLSLLTIALEVGADSIGKYDTLLEMVKDDLCRNVFALLGTERLTIFAADLQVCFLLFESQRVCLKFHLEFYLNKLAEIIGSENPRTPYEMRELALDNLLQFLRIPSFSAELYINYDCNLYCANLLEDLVKLLSKNSLSATQQIYTIHQISLDGLLTIVADIERNFQRVKSTLGGAVVPSIGRHSRNNSSIDKIVLESQTDLNATTSGGEESSTIENIQNIIKSDSKATAQHADGNDHRRGTQVITHDQLVQIKMKKRILTQGTELFNQRPDKGIQFLQENNYLNAQLDSAEVAQFLRENSGLDKKQIGEYISKKKNVDLGILEMFVKSFDFTGVRIDVALRQYLETFRLPGEAPLIFLVMEHFADHWHKLNNEPFANTDAAFRLAYAIIMLNMDQHNHNAKRLNIPMTVEDFQKNLRGLNGNMDFDQDMLLAIYTGIKNEEIIMPAEQTGLVRENYLWKMLLRRNQTKDGHYLSAECALLDKEIFQLVWGPTLAALSFMFDRSTDNTYHKSLIAFAKGAAVSAHFLLHEDFNALILTLCKFTTLLNGLNGIGGADGSSMLMSVASANIANHEITASVQFGLNIKAQLAMKSVFAIVHKHGDCLRCDGWKNCIEVILQLFKLRLLPKNLMEVEDFCEPSGRVALILEKPMQKQEIGLFSSLYSYLSSDGQRQPTYEEQEIIKIAKRCVKECQLDQIIAESKFLHVDALRELIRCLLGSLKAPVAHKSDTVSYYAEDTTVFLLEFLVKILIQNRDRLLPLWNDCRDQIYLLLLGSSCYEYNYLLERTTVALLKLAIYLMRNEELCPVVLQSLKMLLMLKPNIILKISKQISTGMYELLKTSAQNIHTESDWDIVFTLLECVGAGAIPPDFFEDSLALSQAYRGAKSDGALSTGGGDNDSAVLVSPRGYISDSEIPNRIGNNATSSDGSQPAMSAGTPTASENWIIVNKDSEATATIASRPASPVHSLIYPCKLMRHSSFALVKCWDSLAFIVRNVAHITPYNFESCVKCIRTFVEASLNGGNMANAYGLRKTAAYHGHAKSNHMRTSRKDHANVVGNAATGNAISAVNANGMDRNGAWNSQERNENDIEDEELMQRYETIAIQLLDLMHTLHTRTAQIFRWWAEEGGALPQCSALWALGWCPILQGIARLATDQRRQVRTSAVTCLQRALLMPDLQTLTGPEWESCFKQVLFPLLYDLLVEVPNQCMGADLLEESRNRTAYIMSKVFLYHLTSLISLATFSELWLEILEYIEKFMHVGSDMLHEAMLECLKNMLLVMHSDQFRVFHNSDGVTHSPLWELTWSRIGQFLPQLKEELFDKEPIPMNRTIKPDAHTISPVQLPGMTTPLEVTQQTSPSLPSLSSYSQEQIVNSSVPSVPVPVPTSAPLAKQASANLLLTGASPITSLPEVSFQTPASAPLPVPSLATTDQFESLVLQQSLNPCDIQFMPTLTHSQIDVVPSAIPLSASPPSSSPYNQSNYVLNGPYINPNFSKVINLPVTPSPPPLLEADESVESSSSEKMNASPAKQSELETTEPSIPLSHLITANQYPSLNKIPPAHIAQSYAPMYVSQQQHTHQQQQQQQQSSEGEIYSDYVNNPYNLTLQVDQSYANVASSDMVVTTTSVAVTTTATMSAPNMNVFQSVNYFGNANDSAIPPGSEMLFGAP